MTDNPDDRQDALTLLARELHDAADPLERLRRLRQLESWLTQAKEEAVAHALQGRASWTMIGAALEVTRQSAHGMYRRLGPAAPTSDASEEAPTLPTPTPRTRTRHRGAEEWALTTRGGRTLLRLVPTRSGPDGSDP